MDLFGNKIDFSKERLLITGSHGMVGNALLDRLEELVGGPLQFNIICLPQIGILDLRNEIAALKMVSLYKPKYIVHLAAKVGGVKANSDFLADFFTDNIRMNVNILRAAWESRVEKVVSLLSTCIYPDLCSYPLTEDQIHSGPPHQSNYAYAYAKRMLDIQSQAYRDQFGCNFVTVVPNNLYGENDYFDLENSHVVPAMIRKIYEATLSGDDVVLWGDGSPLREFTYARDLAEILLFTLEEYNERSPLNVGNTEEYSIKWVAETVAEIFNFKGRLVWDTSKPAGQFRKPSSNEKFKTMVETRGKNLEYTPFKEGLTRVCKWFKDSYNYDRIRGI